MDLSDLLNLACQVRELYHGDKGNRLYLMERLASLAAYTDEHDVQLKEKVIMLANQAWRADENLLDAQLDKMVNAYRQAAEEA